ncbi:shikimate dehydrogenase [Elusimicrobiota bacterium]
MNINGNTKIIGIFGYPIKHTFSPAMHNAAFKVSGLNFIYTPFEISPNNLSKAISCVKKFNIHGLNITVPHKENALKFIDKADPLAKKIGSINTIVNKNGVLTGYNTDGKGFIKDIKNCGFNPIKKTALLMGAGGAGKAVAAALSWSGAKKIYITDKSQTLARKLVSKIKNSKHFPMSKIKEKIEEADIVINATPIGMKNSKQSLINKNLLRKNLFVYDLVYNHETRLIKDAKKIGAKAYNGIGMLLYQGVLAFELWTGKKAPVSIMRKSLLKNLKRGT